MRIQTFDTTLRDGTQGEAVSFSVEDKILICGKLDELGIVDDFFAVFFEISHGFGDEGQVFFERDA